MEPSEEQSNPKRNGDGKPQRNAKGHFLPGHSIGWPKGVSGNPSGRSKMHDYIREVFQCQSPVTVDGRQLTYAEAFALRLRNAAFGIDANPRVQALAIKVLLDRLDPIPQQIHIADVTPQVQAALSERAREFQELCSQAAAAKGGPLSMGEIENLAGRLAVEVTDVVT